MGHEFRDSERGSQPHCRKKERGEFRRNFRELFKKTKVADNAYKLKNIPPR